MRTCSPRPLAPKGPSGSGFSMRMECDLRDVADGGDEVVVQVLGAAGEVFLHQRQADALGDAAFDLAFGEGGVDGAAEVVGGGELEELDRAEGGVDGELGDLGAVAVDGVGGALAVGVERRGRRVVAFLGGEDVAVRGRRGGWRGRWCGRRRRRGGRGRGRGGRRGRRWRGGGWRRGARGRRAAAALPEM